MAAPSALLKRPAEQGSQLPLPASGCALPAGHGVHAAAPAALNLPPSHVTQDVEPVPAAYFPAAQALQRMPGEEEKLPAPHASHTAAPAETPYPESHLKHKKELAYCWYQPAGQGMQATGAPGT